MRPTFHRNFASSQDLWAGFAQGFTVQFQQRALAPVLFDGFASGLASDRFGDLRASDLTAIRATDLKLTTALAIDGVGDLKPPIVPALLITTDTVPDSNNGSNPTLTVTPAGTTTPIVSTIDTIGDQDYYQVTLTAGTTYELGLYSYNGGPNGTGLTDPYMELYAADGTTLIVSADGGANTPYNDINSGFDVLLVYTPDVTGTYFINARAFSNSPLTSNGDSVGDYQLFARVQDPNDPNIYHPYYDVDEPLYAIDWGTRVNKINQSAANPDGNEGPRPTGNAQGTPVYGSSLDIPALAAAQGVDITGKNVITIYFARAGDVFVSNDPTNPGLPPATITAVGVQDFEHLAVMTALGEFAKVADIVYLEVDDRDDADFIYTSYQGTPGPGISLLGSMSPPDESDEGLAQFNSGDARWNARDLAQGGFSYVTLIHEFGHGHGLAHPHDNGGHSGIMHGVTQETPASVADYTTGDYHLNQSVFTMMSYEDGWQDSPYGNASTTAGYGYLGGLSPFDIAAIQDKYGVNEEYHTGNDTYTLKDVNAAGTFYTGIWDAGGTDQIVYAGTRDTTIDLRAATLQYEFGGGGRVSFAYGIFGGFTIANGVTIENATTDGGNDTLIGNIANNVLNGGAGADIFYLDAGGTDTGIGGAGADAFLFGAALDATDNVDGGADKDQLGLQGNYAAYTFGAANLVNIETLALLSGSDTRFGDPGTSLYSYNLTTVDANVAAGQTLTVNFNGLLAGENVVFNGSAETNGAFFFFGGKGNDTLTGGAGADAFFFGQGAFGAGDTMVGGAGGGDQFGLRGDYTATFGASTMTGIETIALLSGQDVRFGAAAADFHYNLTLHDGNTAAGQQLSINGNGLRAGETMTIDGSAETDGTLRIIAGAANDLLKGGANADIIFGNLGADTLYGGGGNDTFVYTKAADSTSAGRDGIQDFATGDKVDLSRIDAISSTGANDVFTSIGSAAFSHTAGELRFEQQSGPIWLVQGDTNGDGVSDIELLVTVSDAHAITTADFFL